MSDTEIALSKASSTPAQCKIANSGTLYVLIIIIIITYLLTHFSGLFSFASTTFILSLYNIGTRGVATPNVVVGMAVFCGGLAQLLAGMWEFPRGNTFGATGAYGSLFPGYLGNSLRQLSHLLAFTSYGAFWMSFATILIPGSGVAAAYTNTNEFHNALGIYLMTWFIVTFLLLFVFRLTIHLT
jgi:succinate-acetate transporter protein